MARLFLSFLLFLFFSLSTRAQVREIPEKVRTIFEKQYPDAENVTYDDNLISIQFHFTQDGEKMTASYNNKGVWKETQKDASFEQFPADVKDGFAKSKFADWEVKEAKVVYRPGSTKEYYRVKVEKNSLQKMNLLFNDTGRLVEDNITL